jgi:uncharacterized membrane protein
MKQKWNPGNPTGSSGLTLIFVGIGVSILGVILFFWLGNDPYVALRSLGLVCIIGPLLILVGIIALVRHKRVR